MSAYLNPKDIPEPMLMRIRAAFDRCPEVIQLRLKANRLQAQSSFAEAMAVRHQVADLYDRAIASYLSDVEKENDKASISVMAFSDEQQQHMTELTTAMLLAVDVMETCMKNMGDIVASVDKDVKFFGWREIRNLSAAIRSKLEMTGKDAPFVNNPDWGDSADNLFEITLRKARRVLRNDEKRKDNK